MSEAPGGAMHTPVAGSAPQADGRARATQVRFSLDGRPLAADADETILQAALRHGVEIPHLCYRAGAEPAGNCRACVVEIDGERSLAPSCCRRPTPDMVVRSDSERAVGSQRMVLELLLADVAPASHRDDSELAHWAERLAVRRGRFGSRVVPAADVSHPAIAVNLDACIHCTRCLRACRDEQANDVIGYAWRGVASQIVFDLDDPLAASTCVACGECVQACPTGALMPKRIGATSAPSPLQPPGTAPAAVAPADLFLARAAIAPRASDRAVDSLCPFCGVGCQMRYHVVADRISYVEGLAGPANQGRLCVKGRFGFDYVRSPDRLTVPLVRRDDAPKRVDFDRVPSDWRDAFREASWDEALDRAGLGLAAIRDVHGAHALAGFGSAKGSNEEAYLFQKLVRTGMRTNNVDHCTRLCHASSVAALMEGIGSGAVSNPVADVAIADFILVIGANPTANHPVAATFIKNAARRGAVLVLADPRRTELARFAQTVLQFAPDSDVALLNAMLFTIVQEGLVDAEFIARRVDGYEAFVANLAPYSPEAMALVCGIDAGLIRAVARQYARARASMILWGMGVAQHTHGTDNARCLIAMALITGQIGRPGTGLHPLRGQNNVQGASDSGLIPMVLPDYQRVDDDGARARFEALWGARLDPRPGLTVVEILDAAARGVVRGMYIMGENPAMSDPDTAHARKALAALDLLVVQDIFPTETAVMADVILPASAFAEKAGTFTNTDRLVQLGRPVLAPPGQARQDLWIIGQMARRLGLDWPDLDPSRVFAEMRQCMPSIAGITWQRLERESSVTHPCRQEGDPGEPVVFVDGFPTASGRARLMPVSLVAPDERPDAQYPFVLITGRQLEHWHTGAMTRRSRVLDEIEPVATASMNGADLDALGLRAGEAIEVASRRGAIRLAARRDDGVPRGSVFIPFAFAEAAANRLTNPALDPFGKIPGFKFCAVRVAPSDPAGRNGARA